MIEFHNTHQRWQFDLSPRDGGMIAIMLNEELDPNFHAVYDMPIDVTQAPMTWMGVYATYIIEVDTHDFHDQFFHLGYTLADLRDAILIWIEQIIDRAYRYNPLDRRPDHNDTTFLLQRKAVMQLKDTL